MNPVLAGGSFVVPEGMSEVERARFERFKTFQIKGVCNDGDRERLATLGVNTVRGYTIPAAAEMIAKLDDTHRLGMKMIVSEWMPHHGKNKGNDGTPWTFDYNAKEEEMVAKFIEKIEGIGDHPAILMWGLGNEVHLDEPYLRVVNRMSKAIHERFPHHITSLTMINAKEAAIEAVKKYAPDLDVIGIQSYSRGAVRGSIKNAEKFWGKPFYVSEFNTNGPWNFNKTPWGEALDEPVTLKVRDLKDCYKAIDESPLSLGSTIFVWGYYNVSRSTYFSTLLDTDPNGSNSRKPPFDKLLTTPQAEVMAEHFTGKPTSGNRAPVLSKFEFDSFGTSRLAKPGEGMRVNVAAEDADGDVVEFVGWITDPKASKVKTVAGPYKQVASDPATITHMTVPAPEKPGEYLLMIYAVDNKGGGSASMFPFKVPDPNAATEVTPAVTPTVPAAPTAPAAK
jgi:hypothetical protein